MSQWSDSKIMKSIKCHFRTLLELSETCNPLFRPLGDAKSHLHTIHCRPHISRDTGQPRSTPGQLRSREICLKWDRLGKDWKGYDWFSKVSSLMPPSGFARDVT